MKGKTPQIEMLPVASLKPYGRNSRTHSATRKRGMKICVCSVCGVETSVRNDTNPKMCKSCSRIANGRKMAGKHYETTEFSNCQCCGKPILKSLGRTYCSVACMTADKRAERKCKTCGETFHVLKSSLSGTNASGNFCSRPCYEKWMCKTERVTGRGSQWKKTRDGVLASFPFCIMCGTTKKIQVHHIAPFRLSHDNGKENLVPLCMKHHKVIESMTHDVEAAGVTADDMKFIIGNMLAERKSSTIMALREAYGRCRK